MNKPRVIVLRGILKDGHGRYLLLKRSGSCKSWPGHWEFPGGKMGSDEEVGAALQREFLEETGLAVEVGQLFFAFEWERESDRILYLIYNVTSLGSTVAISAEHESYGWYDRNQFDSLMISPPLKNILLDRIE